MSDEILDYGDLRAASIRVLYQQIRHRDVEIRRLREALEYKNGLCSELARQLPTRTVLECQATVANSGRPR